MSSSKYLFIRFLILYLFNRCGDQVNNFTIQSSDNIDIVLLVESLSVEHPLVLLGVGIIEDPGVVVIAVFILSPDSAHGHGVAVVPEHRVIIQLSFTCCTSQHHNCIINYSLYVVLTVFKVFRIMKIYKQKC